MVGTTNSSTSGIGAGSQQPLSDSLQTGAPKTGTAQSNLDNASPKSPTTARTILQSAFQSIKRLATDNALTRLLGVGPPISTPTQARVSPDALPQIGAPLATLTTTSDAANNKTSVTANFDLANIKSQGDKGEALLKGIVSDMTSRVEGLEIDLDSLLQELRSDSPQPRTFSATNNGIRPNVPFSGPVIKTLDDQGQITKTSTEVKLTDIKIPDKDVSIQRLANIALDLQEQEPSLRIDLDKIAEAITSNSASITLTSDPIGISGSKRESSEADTASTASSTSFDSSILEGHTRVGSNEDGSLNFRDELDEASAFTHSSALLDPSLTIDQRFAQGSEEIDQLLDDISRFVGLRKDEKEAGVSDTQSELQRLELQLSALEDGIADLQGAIDETADQLPAEPEKPLGEPAPLKRTGAREGGKKQLQKPLETLTTIKESSVDHEAKLDTLEDYQSKLAEARSQLQSL